MYTNMQLLFEEVKLLSSLVDTRNEKYLYIFSKPSVNLFSELLID